MTNDAANCRRFFLSAFGPAADGVTDDTEAFRRCFLAAAEAPSAEVIIEPGTYALNGSRPVPLSSNLQITATGATFNLPDELGDQARIVLFQGEDLCRVHWRGGCFAGHCFDHLTPPNRWEPNANTRILLFTTSAKGRTDRITVEDVQGEGVAGAVITVTGHQSGGEDSLERNYATNITVRGCDLERCGKFMWDYGLLWQILVWPEEYSPAEQAMAARYCFPDLIHGPMSMENGKDRVTFNNTHGIIRPSRDSSNNESLCFFNGILPANVIRGRQYFVVDSNDSGFRISESFGGAPVRFQGSSAGELQVITTLHIAYYHLYEPIKAGPGKGGVDLVACQNVIMQGNRMSALGDTMHIQKCDTITFQGNHITGSRMGAFFLAEYCSNATITGNTINGTNGSRVMSVEKSCRNVTITGNIFRNGGRGSWINQPQGLILANNIFVCNTTKGEEGKWRGRRSFITGGYECYPELYFTTHEPHGSYGPVIIEGNHFTTGPACVSTIRFDDGGVDLVIRGNTFSGSRRSILVAPGCRNVSESGNLGLGSDPETT